MRRSSTPLSSTFFIYICMSAILRCVGKYWVTFMHILLTLCVVCQSNCGMIQLRHRLSSTQSQCLFVCRTWHRISMHFLFSVVRIYFGLMPILPCTLATAIHPYDSYSLEQMIYNLLAIGVGCDPRWQQYHYPTRTRPNCIGTRIHCLRINKFYIF